MPAGSTTAAMGCCWLLAYNPKDDLIRDLKMHCFTLSSPIHSIPFFPPTCTGHQHSDASWLHGCCEGAGARGSDAACASRWPSSAFARESSASSTGPSASAGALGTGWCEAGAGSAVLAWAAEAGARADRLTEAWTPANFELMSSAADSITCSVAHMSAVGMRQRMRGGVCTCVCARACVTTFVC